MKEYTYINTKTGKIIFTTRLPNHLNEKDADKRLKERKGIDIITTPFIQRAIKRVA